jgi:hypothetical protein
MSKSNPFGLSYSLASKVSRHHQFINMGLSILGAGGVVLAASHHLPLVAGALTVATFMNGLCSFIGAPSNLFNTLPEFVGLSLLKKTLENNQNKFIPFKGKALSFEQSEANKISKLFVASMFLATYNKMNYYHYIQNIPGHASGWFMDFSDNKFNDNKAILLPIYEKNFKHSFILVKSLLNATKDNRLACFSENLFIDLFPIHQNQFSNDEIKYLQKHFKSKDVHDISPLTSEKVFKLLPFNMQEEILVLAQSKIENKNEYESLLLIHQNHEQFEKNETLKEEVQTQGVLQQEKLVQTVSINSQSQEKLDTFEQRFSYIYPEEKDTLNSISELLLVKEKMSYVLDNSDQKQLHIEAKLFLNNDVDNLIKNFNQEILILMKMKANDHPQFSHYKEEILDGIHERVYAIKGKMLDINNQINDVMEQELLSTMQINKTVFKAKV